MFRQPNFSNLRFNIIQAINPLLCIREFDRKYHEFDMLVGRF